ncbi:MAG TPA: hypothetical protein VNK96_04730 [Fimbriimonadales bacterium]|nr:hypothetical protein [Fimbriimonadales bacterium]
MLRPFYKKASRDKDYVSDCTTIDCILFIYPKRVAHHKNVFENTEFGMRKQGMKNKDAVPKQSL